MICIHIFWFIIVHIMYRCTKVLILTSIRDSSSCVIFPTNDLLVDMDSFIAITYISVPICKNFGSSSMSWLFKASYVALHLSTSSWSYKIRYNHRLPSMQCHFISWCDYHKKIPKLLTFFDLDGSLFFSAFCWLAE